MTMNGKDIHGIVVTKAYKYIISDMSSNLHGRRDARLRGLLRWKPKFQGGG